MATDGASGAETLRPADVIAAAADAGRAGEPYALVTVIENLWRIRETSPMVVQLIDKTRSKAVKPHVEEHRHIVAALRKHDSAAARAAMREHITCVIDALLQATETEALQRIQNEIAARRRRFRQPDLAVPEVS